MISRESIYLRTGHKSGQSRQHFRCTYVIEFPPPWMFDYLVDESLLGWKVALPFPMGRSGRLGVQQTTQIASNFRSSRRRCRMLHAAWHATPTRRPITVTACTACQSSSGICTMCAVNGITFILLLKSRFLIWLAGAIGILLCNYRKKNVEYSPKIQHKNSEFFLLFFFVLN